jgi:hypothetical protein
VEKLFITAARQTTRDMFSMWSDPSLLRNNGKAAFSRTMTMTNDRPDLSSEGAPVIDKTILVNVNRNKHQVVRASWALKLGLTDRLVVGCKVTLTLTVS